MLMRSRFGALTDRQNTVERVLEWLTVENKDVRKGPWGNKDVSYFPACFYHLPYLPTPLYDDKEHVCSIKPSSSTGVTPIKNEITLISDPTYHSTFLSPRFIRKKKE